MAKAFKNWTKQEKLVAWLLSLGYEERPCKSGKYRLLQKKGKFVDDVIAGYLIGKAGAFRSTADGTVSKSISRTPSKAFYEWCAVQGDPVRGSREVTC